MADKQANLVVHGGPDKAIYAYPSEHYPYWRTELPEADLPWGVFGENLTTLGLAEDNIHIGDRLKVGSALLKIVQPRMPCFKLALRFDRDDMIKRFLISRRTGFYLAVEEEGELQADSSIEFVSRDPARVSVLDIFNLYMGNVSDPELLDRALHLQALPEDWKNELQSRVQSRRASNHS